MTIYRPITQNSSSNDRVELSFQPFHTITFTLWNSIPWKNQKNVHCVEGGHEHKRDATNLELGYCSSLWGNFWFHLKDLWFIEYSRQFLSSFSGWQSISNREFSLKSSNKIPKFIWSVIVGILIFLLCIGEARTELQTTLPVWEELANFFKGRLDDPQLSQNIAGISLTIGDSHNILFSGCSRADKDNGVWKACDPDHTRFQIGQVSKLFTTVSGIKELSNDMNFSINDFLLERRQPKAIPSKIVGNFESYNGIPVYTTKEDGKMWEDVLIRDLFLGTHGFDDFILGSHAMRSENRVSSLKYFFHEKVEYFTRVRPTMEVHTDNHYATSFLAYLVELKKETTFDQYLKDSIFVQLNLQNTFYSGNTSLWNSDSFMGTVSRSNGLFSHHNIIFQNFAPAMGMLSTTTDLTKFLQIYLQPGSILTEQQIDYLKSSRFRNAHHLPGVTMGWNEEIYNGKTYLYMTGQNGPHHTLVALLPTPTPGLTATFALSASGGIETKSILKGILHLFINKYIEPFICEGINLKLDPRTGKCFKEFLPSEMRSLTNMKHAQGCYVSHQYEHTTWFKLHKLYLPQTCVSQSNQAYLEVSRNGQNFYLALDENDTLRPGKLEGDKFLFEFPYSVAFAFAPNSEGSSRYLFENQEVYEINHTRSDIWKTVLIVYTVILLSCMLVFIFIILLGVEGFFVWREDRKFKYQNLETAIYHADRESEIENGDDNSSDSSECIADEVRLPDAFHMNMAPKRNLPVLSNVGRFIITGFTDIVMQIVLIIASFTLLLHLLLLFMNIVDYSWKENYVTSGFGVQFTLVLPIFTLVLSILMMIGFFCVFFNRVFAKSSVNGCIWLLYFGCMLVLISSYIPIAVYWNLLS